MSDAVRDDDEVLRIANCSGFFGDRLSAAAEMVEGGPIDVLTGDWLAELTMLILARQKMKNADAGWARTFLAQMRDVLAVCVERDVKVVTNAGGLNPAGCAAAVRELAAELGVDCTVAHVTGDDLIDRLGALRAEGVELRNLDTGETLEEAGLTPVTANAYLGGFGIAAALHAGADVVVTGRVTDAALVVGPGAWRFGWGPTDHAALAGAVVAGHVIECGTQATGGNYAFFDTVADLTHPGFPIAELAADGSSVITKHPGTSGAVTVGTVTAQLLYEIDAHRYANPDVTARFDTIRLHQQSPDRVLVHGVAGEPPPPTTKVSVTCLGGFRSSMTFGLTGLDVHAKAELLQRQLWESVPGGRDAFDDVHVRLGPVPPDDPATNDDATTTLTVTVRSHDRDVVGRAFTSRAVELALASYPGFFATSPPTDAQPYGVFWPTVVPNDAVHQQVVFDDGSTVDVAPPPDARPLLSAVPEMADDTVEPSTQGSTTRVPLGRVAGARSGDKGGNANVGVWVADEDAYAWLESYLTLQRFQELLPETAAFEVRRTEFANLHALNFVVVGLLGRGVADAVRTDAQAKGLGEWLRARLVDVPDALLESD